METQLYPERKFFDGTRALLEGWETGDDETRTGRPVTATSESAERVRDLIKSDRRLAVRLIAYGYRRNREAVHELLPEHLGMRKVCPEIMSMNLTSEQKGNLNILLLDYFDRL